EVPLGDFFAVGQGSPAVVESIPVQVSPSGSLTCYWRMPFAVSARITVTNDNPDRWTGLYWQVDWLELDSLPAETPYFHARCRQGTSAGDSGVCYRWHLLDPVRFERSLRFTIEHKGNRTSSEDAWYVERPDFLSSVAFWYQTGAPKPFGELPPWPERRAPWQR